MPWKPRDYDGNRDPLIDAAVGLLGERTGVYRIGPVIGEPPRDVSRDVSRDMIRDSLRRD